MFLSVACNKLNIVIEQCAVHESQTIEGNKNTMKKVFASVLAVVIIVALASTATAAFSWSAGSRDTAESFAERYKIEVVKLANETGIIGTNKMVEAPGATAVNNASVYFYIRLTVSGSNVEDHDEVQENAIASVSFAALGANLPEFNSHICELENGVYYYSLAGAKSQEEENDPDETLVWRSLADFGEPNSVFSAATIEARVLDTATAKVSAKVYSKLPIPKYVPGIEYEDFVIFASSKNVFFVDKNDISKNDISSVNNIVFFTHNGDGKIFAANGVAGCSGNYIAKVFDFLGISGADIEAGKIYMTEDNLRAAFGFDYKAEASATWNANATAIILDPAVGVGIPKTGDNTSVIGFALVMLALVGAAMAVKKVNA